MPTTPSSKNGSEAAILNSYWQGNLRLMGILLLIWAIVGPGCGILFADKLNQFTLPGTGYPLGFWFAQQGSIIVFVLLILVYAILMNRHDREHHAQREQLQKEAPEEDTFMGSGI